MLISVSTVETLLLVITFYVENAIQNVFLYIPVFTRPREIMHRKHCRSVLFHDNITIFRRRSIGIPYYYVYSRKPEIGGLRCPGCHLHVNVSYDIRDVNAVTAVANV